MFDYRGVIIDVDEVFKGSEEWYAIVARSRPPKDKPWYHVLVHDSSDRTYVAERNLEPDESDEPINHPEIYDFFSDVVRGLYLPKNIN
jgi:heat shock protein HspQ